MSSFQHCLLVCFPVFMLSVSIHSSCSPWNSLPPLRGLEMKGFILGHKRNDLPAQALNRLPFGMEWLHCNSLEDWLFLVRMLLGDLGKGLKSPWVCVSNEIAKGKWEAGWSANLSLCWGHEWQAFLIPWWVASKAVLWIPPSAHRVF